MGAWHAERGAQVLKELNSRAEGLSRGEARERLRSAGPNELAPPGRPGLLRRVLGQLKDPMILVLLGAAGVSLAASRGRDWLDGAIILVIVVVNGILSITQEDQAHRALEELRRMSAPMARVLREGREERIPAAEVVPGDILHLEAGDQVPADGRLLSCAGLQADESAMTGESLPVDKQADRVLSPETAVGDRSNLLLAGSLITRGRGTAVVTATGMETQMGRIAGLLLSGETRETPLQRKMGEISAVLSLLCLAVCAVMFGTGLLRGKGFWEMLLTAVSLAVAAIPEGLPAIVTIVLALGVQRMAGRGAIIKRLPAVETLGCASVICSDKTGTLTRNRMEVRELWVPAGGHRKEVLLAGCLCSDARLVQTGGRPVAQGDPTEAALVEAAAREGLDQSALARRWPRTGELPFDSGRKLMSTVHRREDGGWTALVKGAPDILLSRCTDGPNGPLTPADRQEIEEACQTMARQALRVIGVACRGLNLLPPGLEPGAVERDLTFLGLFGLMDPPRREAAAAVAQCRRAGVRPVMITGDHRDTAAAVARALGLYRPGDLILTGADLDFMPQEALAEEIGKISVFARVSPEHKLRIVQAWQSRGHIVAMTGDGVNDAPALKAADIGCAMGIAGTDVAKGAADMILTDDNFSTIVAAVEEGRGIYANIRKAIHYLLSCNLGEITALFLGTLLDLRPMPLLPVQLLWLNLVTDSLPALALGVEPVEREVMDQRPRNVRAGLFDRGFTLRLLWQGLMVGGLTLAAYFLGLGPLNSAAGPQGANTMAFAALTLSQLFHAFNVRSEDRSLFHLGVASNPAMNRAFLAGLALQLAVLLLPPLRGVFSVVPMTAGQWLAVFLLAAAPVPVCEGEKWVRGRVRRGEKVRS